MKTNIQKEKEKLKKLEISLASTQEAYDILCKQRKSIFDKMMKSKERITTLERESFDVSAGFTEEFITWLLSVEETQAKYESLKILSDVTNGQLRFSGYNHNMQNSISLCLRHGEDFTLAEEYLTKLLPFVKPTEDNWKPIDIFEKTCSEFGSYYLIIKEDVYKIIKYVHGREELVESYDNLHDALSYISTYVYYE